MSTTMDTLRALADGRASAPEKAGPHPDAELLNCCATYLDLCADAAAIEREKRAEIQRQKGAYVGNPDFDAACARWKAKEAEAKRMLTRLGRMRASTAAGIYAKAAIVATRRGYMTAPRFVLSLAEDLVKNPTLRQSLWPAEVE